MGRAHGLGGLADAGAFLSRLVRLDAAAVVRLRSTGTGHTVLWARLPWDALVTRTVAGPGPGDVTVDAAELLAAVAAGAGSLPQRRDGQWRWPLPPATGRVVIEAVASAQVRRLAQAAAGTLRAAARDGLAGRPVGERVLRDALLDHVALVVTEPLAAGRVVADPTASDPDRPVEVSQRLIQAVTRMGFLGSEQSAADPVQVMVVRRWVGLSAPYGVAWLRKDHELTVRPIVVQTIG